MKKLMVFVVFALFLGSCVPIQQYKTVPTLPTVKNVHGTGGIMSVKLTWSMVENPRVKGYIIYRAPSKSGPFKKIATINSRFQTEYVDTGGLFEHLGNYTTYFYRIATFSDKGVSLPSETVAVTTAPPPASVTHITAKSGLPRMVVVRWNPPKDKSVTGYIVYMSRSKIGPYKQVGRVLGYSHTFYIKHGLEDGTTYYFSVASMNYKGVVSKLVAYAKATTKPKPLPPRRLMGMIAGAGKIKLSWWPSITPDVVKYAIYRGTCPTCLAEVATVSSSKLFYTDSNLSPGTTYWYRVESIDVDGIESSGGPVRPFKTQPLPQPPLGIAAVELPNGDIKLTWDKAGKDVVAYKVYMQSLLIFSKEITETKNTYCIYAGAKKGKTYTFWVRSVDIYNQVGPPSAKVSITIQ